MRKKSSSQSYSNVPGRNMADNKSKRLILGSEPLSEDEEIPHLPIELLTGILLRLPAKLLLCYRRVCKVWCKIIDSPSFVNAHLTSYPKESELVFLKDPTHRRDTLKFHLLEVDIFNSNVNMSRHPIAEFIDPYYLASSENSSYLTYLSHNLGYGLFLFQSKSCEEVFLYNPLKDEVLVLPPAGESPNRFWDHDFSMNTFCLGFDSGTNEYKIVHTYNVEGRGPYDFISNSVVTEIYTLGTSSWREIDVVPPLIPHREAVSAQGDIHWKILTIDFSTKYGVHKPMYNIDREKLLTFDLKKEEYKLTNLPELQCKSWCKRWFRMFNLKEFLSVSSIVSGGGDTIRLEIWILKDYEKQEWVKQYTINNAASVIGAWQDGVILCSGFKDLELFYYDPETDGQATMVRPSNLYGSMIVICASSLLSLKNYGDLMVKKTSPERGTDYFNLNKAYSALLLFFW